MSSLLPRIAILQKIAVTKQQQLKINNIMYCLWKTKPGIDVELLCRTVQLSLCSSLYQMDTSEKWTPDVGPYNSQGSYRFLNTKFWNSLNKFIKRKQRKSQQWFGYRTLITIKFYELYLWISPRIIVQLRSYIQNSIQGFIWYPDTSKSVLKK